MVHTIELNGKNYDLLFGNYAFKLLENEFDISLPDVSERFSSGDLLIIPDIVYCAMKAADAYYKRPTTSTADEVCFDIDMTPNCMIDIQKMLMDSIMNMAGAGEGKKKKE